MKIQNIIAKRLRESRKAAGYKSAKEFALSQNIPTSTYSQHESGKRSISSDLLIEYSSKLKISPSWLLTGEGNPYFAFHDLNKQVDQANLKIPNDNCNYKLIDISLLRKVLLMSEDLFKNELINLTFSELIDHCLDVFEIVSTISVDNNEKEKIIYLTISSLKKGTSTTSKSKKMFL